jgi:hypothetical protein
LGNDPNGIVYAEYGFAAPTVVLGATIPGATGPVGGGVRLTLTGPTGPIQYQQLTPQGGPTGTVYTLATTVPGTDALIPSGFTGAMVGGTGTVLLPSGAGSAVIVGQTEVHVHTTSRMWGMATVEILSSSNSSHTVSFYMVVDGETSNTTSTTNKASGESTALSLHHRTGVIAPGTYNVTVYGYASASNSASVTHCDIFGMGNLA